MTNTDNARELDRNTKVFFYLCAGFCISFFVWASFSPLDIVSDAVGEVIPSSRVKRIQHLEGGIVRKIVVREGDLVEVGQPLIELETTASDSTVEELNVRVSSLTAEIARLEAESRWFVVGVDAAAQEESADANATRSEDSGIEPLELPSVEVAGVGLRLDPFSVEIAFPEQLLHDAPGMADQARQLYEARRERFVNDLNAQREKIKQREQDVQEIFVRIRNQKQGLVYVREQIAISEELLKDKLTTRYKHLGFLKEESTLISRIQEDDAALARARSALVAARDSLDQIFNSFHEEVQETLRKSRRELLEFSQRLRKMSDSLERTVIRSPANGIVKSIYIMGEGEVVQPGMTVLDIVPAGDKLVIEAHLALGDIGYVQVGQSATVSLATGDARMFGHLEGTVATISPDAITKEDVGTYYKVLVETENDRFEKDGRRYQLYPGMRVLVGIKTGERTVMEYLVYPYFDTLYHGMRER
ncbi:MAG: HlyD family type I secretion periplasmic adaptor subunit [Pseudodesulfovibrio sp.]|uniref:Type I secretion membrane fusion protein, HlyD family n=1 Tax=Pseudodesulfovibrio aespoeensis (strain ATCC 700646 / DSM 10631 / Aspo-2) TaxID=643562 RepID=E6VW26_PSEA9|nr:MULTISPECIES: HlyD family type I secretion periplasmic adaptor subunit [Pseudodesulfovibrio]MBU4475286.1 HlyD family type I secretion periplasmic adaptor subunit [Pseudomonadota bacterium]ADU62471.1 type I secretion membrane fusion protein, HlyD family [Pseudodesulfovibrio aespoeensis Aspo-2]MBU4515062.1 HlyD family type I secretion periplasmic adaptor subunit [Pseudomonadota bacterium]MBU4520967.1 HlyD family type I secretion periplasmic adaptor subunit [Pseudomonadota bacterium]MBU4559173